MAASLGKFLGRGVVGRGKPPQTEEVAVREIACLFLILGPVEMLKVVILEAPRAVALGVQDALIVLLVLVVLVWMVDDMLGDGVPAFFLILFCASYG